MQVFYITRTAFYGYPANVQSRKYLRRQTIRIRVVFRNSNIRIGSAIFKAQVSLCEALMGGQTGRRLLRGCSEAGRMKLISSNNVCKCQEGDLWGWEWRSARAQCIYACTSPNLNTWRPSVFRKRLWWDYRCRKNEYWPWSVHRPQLSAPC